MTTYEQVIEFFMSFPRFGKKGGTQKIQKLLSLLGNPQNELKFIHIAGTNGKGSVCCMLSQILMEAGYTTGLFISPYIVDFRERIQVNNMFIDKEILIRAAEEVRECVQKCNLDSDNFCSFEIMTAAAFLCFKYAGCELVVLETGVGGKNDCTNVVSNVLCSVITAIGLDHTEILGDTVEEIAREKAGIIKQNSTVVTAAQPKGAMYEIIKASREKHSKLYFSSEIRLERVKHSFEGISFEYNAAAHRLRLLGIFQEENIRAALKTVEVLRSLGIDINGGAVKRGLENTRHPARFEVLSQSPPIILDGAHNPNGIAALKKSLEIYLCGKKAIGLVAMLSDKDALGSLQILSSVFDEVFLTGVPDNSRALAPERLAQLAGEKFRFIHNEPDLLAAFEAARARAEERDSALVICGSLYLASKLRQYILSN